MAQIVQTTLIRTTTIELTDKEILTLKQACNYCRDRSPVEVNSLTHTLATFFTELNERANEHVDMNRGTHG